MWQIAQIASVRSSSSPNTAQNGNFRPDMDMAMQQTSTIL
jgi:hypothetical protein